MFSILVIAACAICLAIYLWMRNQTGQLPPAPRRALPILGHLLYMKADSRTQFREWRSQCGDIFSFYMGGTLVVVLNGYEVIKEALVKKADVFSNRPPYFINDAIGANDAGIIIANGSNWKEQRSVTLTILRKFGMGKNILADKIQEEVLHYMDYLTNLKGTPTDIRVMTNISTSNIICAIMMGNRYDYDDAVFQDIIRKLASTVNEQQNVSIINFFYWLRYLPGDFFNARRLEHNTLVIHNLFMEIIKEKKRITDKPEDVDNVIDAYCMEQERRLREGIPTNLNDLNLLITILDLFAAGSETTSTTISWFLLYMLHYPDVQEKIYQEIKEKVGTNRTPTISEKSELVYLNATIMETQRLASIVPLAISHMTSDHTTLRDFQIPKGTYVMPNLDSVHHDPTIWGPDVMSFRPERFIDDNKTLKLPEQFIPFGIGRRVCLGEAMARMELFIYLSIMLQRFKFLPAQPGSLPTLDYECGIVIAPRPYQLRIIERT